MYQPRPELNLRADVTKAWGLAAREGFVGVARAFTPVRAFG
jgi:hypothetical protein